MRVNLLADSFERRRTRLWRRPPKSWAGPPRTGRTRTPTPPPPRAPRGRPTRGPSTRGATGGTARAIFSPDLARGRRPRAIPARASRRRSRPRARRRRARWTPARRAATRRASRRRRGARRRYPAVARRTAPAPSPAVATFCSTSAAAPGSYRGAARFPASAARRRRTARAPSPSKSSWRTVTGKPGPELRDRQRYRRVARGPLGHPRRQRAFRRHEKRPRDRAHRRER